MPKPSANRSNLTVWVIRRFLSTGLDSLSNVGRLAFAGLVLSIFVLVVVLSVVNGFEREMRTRILAIIPHVSVDIAPADAAAASANIARIRQAASNGKIFPWAGVAQKSQANVLLAKGERILGVQATGVDAHYAEVSALSDFVTPGSMERMLDERFTVILGAGVASQLEVGIGDQVRLVLPAGAVSAAGVVPRQRAMRVVGIYRSQSLLDQQGLFLNLQSANKLLRLKHAQGLHLKLHDLFAVEETVQTLRQEFGERLRIRVWMDTYGPLYQAIAVQKVTMFILLLFLVSVAAFNLISGLVMIVEQRRSDIAVLQTLGYETADVQRLFVLLGLALAVSGIFIGLLCGTLAAWGLPHVFSFVSQNLQLDLMSQYFITYLPAQVRITDLMTIAGIAAVLAFLATIIPARRAAQTSPSATLSHE
ncbi:MAG: FtsX-like permease family protein [Pseudomonadota bacterium]